MRAAILFPHQNKFKLIIKNDIILRDITDNEILIKNQYSALNRADVFQKYNLYPLPNIAISQNMAPGLECAGEIVKIGENVTNFNIGDRVTSLVEDHAHAEYVIVKPEYSIKIPDNIDYKDAICWPEAFATCWYNLFIQGLDFNNLNGQTILFHGGASGIGVMAIQLAKLFGLKIITTVGNNDKKKLCLNLNADLVINYNEEDFVEMVNDYTNKQGVDLIIDMVAGDYFDKNLKLLKRYGKLIQIAFLKSAKINANIAPILTKNLTISGTTIRNLDKDKKKQVFTDIDKYILPLIESEKIKSIISKEFPSADINDAYDYMESMQHYGKIIIRW